MTDIKNSKPRVVFFGTPSFVTPILDSLHQNFDLVGIVTGPDQILGRKKIVTPTPVKQWGQDKTPHTKILTPLKLDSKVMEEISALAPDLFIVAAYGKIIPQKLLDIPQMGCINVHPSLLPKWRGASPIQSTLLAGDKTTGLTLIQMDSEMDHGPVVYQQEFPISPADNFETLHTTLFNHAAQILPQVIMDFLTQKITPQEQDHTQATFCKLIKREDGYFEIETPPATEKLNRMVRAYYPWPAVWTRWKGKIIKLLPHQQVQMEGKKAVSLGDFLNGYPDFPIKQW